MKFKLQTTWIQSLLTATVVTVGVFGWSKTACAQQPQVTASAGINELQILQDEVSILNSFKRLWEPRLATISADINSLLAAVAQLGAQIDRSNPTHPSRFRVLDFNRGGNTTGCHVVDVSYCYNEIGCQLRLERDVGSYSVNVDALRFVTGGYQPTNSSYLFPSSLDSSIDRLGQIETILKSKGQPPPTGYFASSIMTQPFGFGTIPIYSNYGQGIAQATVSDLWNRSDGRAFYAVTGIPSGCIPDIDERQETSIFPRNYGGTSIHTPQPAFYGMDSSKLTFFAPPTSSNNKFRLTITRLSAL